MAGPDLEHLLNQIPNAKIDHVERSQLLTEQIGKERVAMHRLSTLNLALNDTNSQCQIQPKFSINPYNKSMSFSHLVPLRLALLMFF